MQVGISQYVFPAEMPTTQFLDLAAAAGYECVELALRREGSLTLQTTKRELDAIADRARDRGLKLVTLAQTHTTGNLLDSGDARKMSIDQTVAGLEMASHLGIDCALHTLGKLKPDLYYNRAYDNAYASLRLLAPICSDLRIDLAIEVTWNGFLFSPLEMRRLLDELGNPWIGVNFDPGNVAVFQYPHHWAFILGRWIRRVHVKDWKGNAMAGSFPPLLEGEVDFALLMRELRAAEYDGPMIAEVPPSVAPIEKTAAAVRKIIKMGY